MGSVELRRWMPFACALVAAGCPVDTIREVPPGCTEVREGCLCDSPEPVACAETGGARQEIGECAPGLRSCIDGLWGPCEGELMPAPERCDDGLDNDCDGAADEGALCDCTDGCTEADAGCFEGAEIDGLVPAADEGCDLTLATREETLSDAWIANTLDGTVSRIDTVRAVEIARYPSIDGGDYGAPALGTELPCNSDLVSGNCPSRTAVAPNGDAFVANRAFHAQGTLTKIAGHPDRCEDRNGDGAIQTSQDLDGDGIISTFAQDGEYLGVEDECVLWTVRVGEVGDVPRAVAIAPTDEPGATGTVWVGLFEAMRAVSFDPGTGAVQANVPLDVHPYGAVASTDGRVWFSETEWGELANLQAIDGESGQAEALQTPPPIGDCVGSYGIALDEAGRIWRGAAPCVGVSRFDPATNVWTHYAPEGSGVSAGVATDGEGHVWAVFFQDGARDPMARVGRLDTENGTMDLQYDLGVVDPWGVGLDGEGDAWVVAKGSDRAIEIDHDTGQTRSVPTGRTPYTYSDFTGYQLYQVTDPVGTIDLVFEGCPAASDDPTQWFDVRTIADVPDGAVVEVTLRNADTEDTLPGAPWLGPVGLTADARDLDGRLLEVHIELRASPDGEAPVLHDVQVAFSCPDVAN